jgi:hypothetical protein
MYTVKEKNPGKHIQHEDNVYCEERVGIINQIESLDKKNKNH